MNQPLVHRIRCSILCPYQRPDSYAYEAQARQVMQIFSADVLGYDTACQYTDPRGNDKSQ